MRAVRIAFALFAAVLVVFVGLILSGNLPSARERLDALAADWTGAPLDAGIVEAGNDAATKVQAAPLSSAQLTAPLFHVTFLAECGAPPDMKVVIKATVRMGRAVDVLVTTDPAEPVIAGCIERKTRDLRWDPSRKTDHVTVRY